MSEIITRHEFGPPEEAFWEDEMRIDEIDGKTVISSMRGGYIAIEEGTLDLMKQR